MTRSYAKAVSFIREQMIGWAEVRREPFRVFFPLAVLFGCFGAGHWLAYAVGWRTSYSGFYHASLQVGAYMSCFIIGFLLTALPRFTSSPPASTIELGAALGLTILYAGSLWARQWVLAEGSFLGLLGVVAIFAGRRVAKRREAVSPPAEFAWIFMALAHGVVGLVLIMLGQLERVPSWVLGVGRPMFQQGFLLGIVLGVGGFMAPRLLGRKAIPVTSPAADPEQVRAVRRRRIRLHALAGLVFFASFWMEGAGAIGPAYLLRAAVVTAEFLWTSKFDRVPAVKDRYVHFLWWSIWMIVSGFWGAGLMPRHRVAMLHLVFLGGLSLMTFAIGTMVVLSHSGQAQQLRRPLWMLRVVGLGVGGAVVARLIAEWQPQAFFQWLGVAASCWIVAGLSWLLVMLPRLLQPPEPAAFERAHEDAKKRLLKTASSAHEEPSCTRG